MRCKPSYKAAVTDQESLRFTYDAIGDIAIIRLMAKATQASQAAEQIMAMHRNVKTVWIQSGPVLGDYRLMKLEFLSGEKKSVTVHKESGCSFHVDVEKCYFSPRLSYERLRIAE